MIHEQYYQLIRQYGKYDIEYVLYEARKDGRNNIEIASMPFVLTGNHPEEIMDTLKQIQRDIKEHPAVDKEECNIFHTKLWHEDDGLLPEDFDDNNDDFLDDYGDDDDGYLYEE